MALKDKYSQLINYAQRPLVNNLSVTEQNGVLYISGTASARTKDKLWEIYNQIDPDMRAGDVVLNIDTEDGEGTGNNQYEIKAGDSLSKIASRYPDMTWQKIYDANKDVINDPNKIYPGQKIRIPV